MVHGYWLAVEKCEPGELYLIGSENEDNVCTFREALENLISYSKVSGIKYEVDPKYVRPTQVPRLICDASKFVKKTHWEPVLTLDDILKTTLEYWRYEVTNGLIK
jgi:GDP-4-dehydro-6-deoxy-D-mannose reductase